MNPIFPPYTLGLVSNMSRDSGTDEGESMMSDDNDDDYTSIDEST